MNRSETSRWLNRQAENLRAEYRTCPDCGHRVPSTEALFFHQLRFCAGETGGELKRLGEAMGYRPASATQGVEVERILRLVRE